MKYFDIIAIHNDEVISDIEIDDTLDYIVYCNIEFYGFTEYYEDYTEHYDKKVPLGNIKGYLILSHIINCMLDDVYSVCDDHSADLEMVASILSKHNEEPIYDDIFYIEDITIPDNVFSRIMKYLPETIMKHYHSYPSIIAYYPSPLPYKVEKTMAQKVKEEMAQIITRDILESKNNPQIQGEQEIQVGLDDEQLNYILGRWSNYNAYPESAKDKKEFERFEKAGFEEINNSRLLYKIY